MKKSMKSETIVALTANAISVARSTCREAVEVADKMTKLAKIATRHAQCAVDVNKNPLDYKQIARLSLVAATLDDAIEEAKTALRAPWPERARPS